MTAALDQVVKSLVSSGVISEEELHSFICDLPAERRPTDSEALVGELLLHERLTEYQAEVIRGVESQPLMLGEYKVTDKLGQGGMGVVYKAKSPDMERFVAIKALASQDPDSLERFQREIKAGAKLNHKNIVAVYHTLQHEDLPCLVMEYIEGANLRDLVGQRGPLNPAQAINVVLQAARGLRHCHQQGIVHRDVKPSNLYVNREGAVKLLDLGLARFIGAAATAASDSRTSDLTEIGQCMGTHGYMAPEQASDARRADQRSDIYSLGCTLYYLLAGDTFNKGDGSDSHPEEDSEEPVPSLVDTHPDVPASLDVIFRRMVERKPAGRYQKIEDVIVALKAAAVALPEFDESAIVDDITELPHSITLPDETNATASAAYSTRKPKLGRRTSRLSVARSISIVLAVAAAIGGLSFVLFARNDDGPLIRKESFTFEEAADYQIQESRRYKIPRAFTNSLGADFVLIPSYQSPTGDESASIPRPFYFAACEVTQQEYEEVMGNNPSWFVHRESVPREIRKRRASEAVGQITDTSQFPVENVSRVDAVEFCRLLNNRAAEKRAGRTYRLATESEWLFAARSGSTGNFCFGDDLPRLEDFDWFRGNSKNRPHDVGTLQPNGFGVHDVHGNVEEWTSTMNGLLCHVRGGHFGQSDYATTFDRCYEAQETGAIEVRGMRLVCEFVEIQTHR